MNQLPGSVSPRALRDARGMLHHAVQHLTRAARANLVAKKDDSHSSLGWDNHARAFITHDLAARDGAVEIALNVETLLLYLRRGRESQHETVLDEHSLAGRSDAEVSRWLDAVLESHGLKRVADVVLPYPPSEIGSHPVGEGGVYSPIDHQAELAELAAWYGLGSGVLEPVRGRFSSSGAEASPIRCWPHHFDLATLISIRGSGEDAKSIGVGLSPGDVSYDQPYFYVSPWPYPANVAGAPLRLGHWHTNGFTAAVLTGEAALANHSIREDVARFLSEAIDASLQLIGA